MTAPRSMPKTSVVFSVERAMAEISTNTQKALFEPIEDGQGRGPAYGRGHLQAAHRQFPVQSRRGDAVIVARESAPANKTDPVGTGPFKFSRCVKADRVELVRNNTYWGERAALGSASFKFITDPAAATAALLAGDVDAFANFPAPEVLGQFQSDKRFRVVTGTTEGETILAINNRKPPLDDVMVRRAIAHAINREKIVISAMFGQGTPIGSHFAPHHDAYLDHTEKARALLAEAGYGQGFSLTLKLPPPTYAKRSGEIVAAQLNWHHCRNDPVRMGAMA